MAPDEKADLEARVAQMKPYAEECERHHAVWKSAEEAAWVACQDQLLGDQNMEAGAEAIRAASHAYALYLVKYLWMRSMAKKLGLNVTVHEYKLDSEKSEGATVQ